MRTRWQVKIPVNAVNRGIDMEINQRIAVAVKQGKAQLQRITYRANGSCDVLALTGWIGIGQAMRLKADVAAKLATVSYNGRICAC